MDPGTRIIVLAADEDGPTPGWRRVILTSADSSTHFQVFVDLDPEECWAVAESLLKKVASPSDPKPEDVNGI